LHSQSYDLFLDFGASFTKVTAINKNGTTILEQRIKAPALNQNDLQVHLRNYDAREYAKHAETSFNAVVADFGQPANVAVSGQVATYILLDNLNQPLTPIVSWQDTSSLDPDLSSSRISPKEASEIILEDGVRPGLPALSIYSYLSKLTKDSFGKKKYVPLTSYLLMRISGNDFPINLIHSSEAHASGFYSLSKKSWVWTDNFKEQYPEIVFPDVIHTPHYYIDSAKMTRYWLPVGDQQAAVFGSNVSEDTCIIHIATGGQVIRYSKEFFLGNNSSLQIRPTLDGVGYLLTATHLPAGRLFNKVLNFLSNETGYRIDWNFLELISTNELLETQVELDAEQLNQDYGNLPSLVDFNLSPSRYLSALLMGVGSVYASKAKLLLSQERTKIHYSGGLICKSKNLQFVINLKMANSAASINLEGDTSIAGLNKMINAG
jgi:sugar (pentulose or hexulose) kinase